MSWIITGSFAQPDEPEALTYIAAVEAADGEALEDGVKFAYNSFIKGCKADGIWNAIKASCILAGARTLAGALVPLVGTAPTNYNFVAGDYNRETGLVGDGSTKYLNSNRNNNSDPQNNQHACIVASTAGSSAEYYLGAGNSGSGATDMGSNSAGNTFARSRTNTVTTITSAASGFIGISRANSSVFTIRVASANTSASLTSSTPYDGNIFVFSSTGSSARTTARLSFYSIGESLDLALLDARVSTLMSDLAEAIP